jgi:hypothetical protein
MKKLLFITAILVFLAGCQSGKNTGQGNIPEGVHAVLIEEVLQTNQYTYLRVKESDAENWLAVSKMIVKPGETYYYKDGLLMNDFESKELNRTFKKILFLNDLSGNPASLRNTSNDLSLNQNTSSAPPMTGSAPEEGTEQAETTTTPGEHTIVAEEVLQTSKYTYIRGKENNEDIWLAVTKMEAFAGNTYFFKGGMIMTDFTSKELKKTFNKILFVDNITTTDKESKKSNEPEMNGVISKGSAIDLVRKDIKFKHGKGDITIAMLYENKKNYNGKSVKLKGKVTKFNAGILSKNWIHLQDGTVFSGKFDLTVTTNQEVNVGEEVTVEGIINLDKDFGFGYFYDVIMEDAKLTK